MIVEAHHIVQTMSRWSAPNGRNAHGWFFDRTMAAEARSIRPDANDPASHNPAGGTGGIGTSSESASLGGAAAGSLSTSPATRLTPLRELQLIEAYRSGGGGPDSHKALSELLAAYQRRIYSVCFRMVRQPEDAADLTQDVLMKVVENLSNYDGRSKLSTWIIRVAMNASLSHLRRAKTRETKSLDAPNNNRTESGIGHAQSRQAGLTGREPSPAENVEQEQHRALVLQALESLDAETKAILVLRDMQDMDYQQLAEALDVPLGTVKSRLFRARAAFRQALDSVGGE